MQQDKVITSKFHLITQSLSMGVFLIGALVLLGWFDNISLLKSISPDWITMKANTAICFVLTGAALFLLEVNDFYRVKSIFIALFASFVLIFSLVTLYENIIHVNLGLDQLLFHEPDTVTALHGPPGRISGLSAFNFLLSSIAILLLKMQN